MHTSRAPRAARRKRLVAGARNCYQGGGEGKGIAARAGGHPMAAASSAESRAAVGAPAAGKRRELGLIPLYVAALCCSVALLFFSLGKRYAPPTRVEYRLLPYQLTDDPSGMPPQAVKEILDGY